VDSSALAGLEHGNWIDYLAASVALTPMASSSAIAAS
jgi:hypothetical protein